MTKEKFDLKYRGQNGKKVAVHCDTKEKDMSFRKQAKSFGYKYASGNDLETYDYYENEKGCYYISECGVRHSSIDFIPKGGRIVEFKLDEPNGYAIEDTPSPTKEAFKVGDEVYTTTGFKAKIVDTAWIVEYAHESGVFFKRNSELCHNKPLKKITEKELAKMGYVLEK